MTAEARSQGHEAGAGSGKKGSRTMHNPICDRTRSRIDEKRSRPTFTSAFQPACMAAAASTAVKTMGSNVSS
jgi:hypothetical protein